MARIASRQFKFPEIWSQFIEAELARLGTESLRDVGRLREAVLKLSDFYIQNPGRPTPWEQNWARIAYLVYYFPLNYLRAQAVIGEATQVGFFEGLSQFCEIGSGPGTVALQLQSRFATGYCIETSSYARDLHGRWSRELQRSANAGQTAPNREADGHKAPPFILKFEEPDSGRSKQLLMVYSYVLNEMGFDKLLPDTAEAFLVIEPSTQEVGRQLMTLRQRLLKQGYYAWAPCTHQGACPLLTGSKRDWCHDRVAPLMPEWFRQLEAGLPMKNATITFSYLLLKKSAPPPQVERFRLVGDTLEERGKSRQLICRGEKREFLSWLHRQFKNLEFERGLTLTTDALELEPKGEELRIQKILKSE